MGLDLSRAIFLTRSLMQGRYIINVYPSKMSLMVLIAAFSAATRLLLWLSINNWPDAAYSMSLAHLSLFDMIQALAQDVGEPLYYSLLKCWSAVFGSSVSTSALLSVFISSCTPVVVYSVAYVMFGDKAGLIAGFLMAINPASLQMSTYVNFYCLLELLSAISILYFVKILEKEKDVPLSYVVGGSVVAILGVYTYAYFWLLLMSEVLACVFFFKTKLRQLIAIFFFTVGAFMSWGPVVWVQLHHMPQACLEKVPGYTAAVDIFLDTLACKLFGREKCIDVCKIIFCLIASYLTFRLIIRPPDDSVIVDGESKALTLWFCTVFCMVIPIAISIQYPIYLPGRYDTIVNPLLVVTCAYYISRCYSLVIIVIFAALLFNMASTSPSVIW